MQNAAQAESRKKPFKLDAGQAQQDNTGCCYLAACPQAGEHGDADYGYDAAV